MKQSNQIPLGIGKEAANKNRKIGWNLEEEELKPQTHIHHHVQPEPKPSGTQTEERRWAPEKLNCPVLGTPNKQKAAVRQRIKMSGIKYKSIFWTLAHIF